MCDPSVSIVVLTFDREEEIRRNVDELIKIQRPNTEILVVDNNSEKNVATLLEYAPEIQVLTMEANVGVGARNAGIKKAKGDIIITLDDDVFGMNDESVEKIVQLFNEQESLGAVNFKVIDDVTEEQMNWIHHREIEVYAETSFNTYEISEGASAFRATALKKTNLYPEYYFISHEGPDLAYQLIKASYKVIYAPSIIVRHSHAVGGRKNWRRYFYDTRNTLWLVYRHLPFGMALKYLFIAWSSMFVYSLRDRYLKYWFKGVIAGLSRLSSIREEREPLSGDALQYVKQIEASNPGFWYMVKKRLFDKKVSI